MSALKKITHEEQGEVNVGVAHTPTFTDTPLAIDLFLVDSTHHFTREWPTCFRSSFR